MTVNSMLNSNCKRILHKFIFYSNTPILIKNGRFYVLEIKKLKISKDTWVI